MGFLKFSVLLVAFLLILPTVLSANPDPRKCLEEIKIDFRAEYGQDLGDLFVDGTDSTVTTIDGKRKVLELVSDCYDVDFYVPSFLGFKNYWGTERWSMFLFYDPYLVNKYVGVFQVGDDLMVWYNMTRTMPDCGTVTCNQWVSDKGKIVQYDWYDDPTHSAMGYFVIPYFHRELGKQYGRFYFNPVDAGNVRWGMESDAHGSMTPTGNDSSLYIMKTSSTGLFKVSYYNVTGDWEDGLFDNTSSSSYGYCFDITSSGSYVMNSDIYSPVPRGDDSICIRVNASAILDMGGHKLVHLIGGSSTGIHVESPIPDFMSGVEVTNGYIYNFPYNGLHTGWLNQSTVSNIFFEGNELAYSLSFSEGINVRYLMFEENQRGMRIMGVDGLNMSGCSGANVEYDVDMNFVRNSIMSGAFGRRYIESRTHREWSMSDVSWRCQDCFNNTFWVLDVLGQYKSFELTGSMSYGNFFAYSVFRDAEAETWEGGQIGSPARVGLTLNESTHNNYGCELEGAIFDYGTDNLFVEMCPEGVIKGLGCVDTDFCINNKTKAHIDSRCYISNITTCDYYCSKGECIPEPFIEWFIGNLPVLFQTPTVRMMFITMLMSIGGVAVGVETKSWVLGSAVALMLLVFGVMLDFVPAWMGLVVFIIGAFLMFFELKGRGGGM